MKKCGIIYTTFYPEDRYLLVFGKKSEKWGFPKGHMEEGESEEQTAIRELFEETGIRIHYSHLQEKIRFKNNIYFRVRGHYRPLTHIPDQHEIQLANWFTLPEIIHSIPKDTMNFGLKSWISYMTSYH